MRAKGRLIKMIQLSLVTLSLGFVPLVLSADGASYHSESARDCLSCHQDLLSGSVGHFIERNDDCMMCHELLTANSTVMTLRSNNTCQVCHVNVTSTSASDSHANASCVDCHDAHSSDNPRLFRKTETQLCQGDCHGDHDLGLSHPVGESVTDSRSGGAMSCVSTCHSMHQPAEPKMLQMAALDLCYQCHGDKF